ncbi:hypothetical protein V1527DRAFT_477545 [Lipomyces starkeyi]
MTTSVHICRSLTLFGWIATALILCSELTSPDIGSGHVAGKVRQLARASSSINTLCNEHDLEYSVHKMLAFMYLLYSICKRLLDSYSRSQI